MAPVNVCKVHVPHCRTGSWKYSSSSCSQSQVQDGHDGIGSDVAPAKRFFKVHWPNRSSFFPVDWHSDHHKKTCPYAERNPQRMPVDLPHDEGRSRASWSCAIFLLTPQPDRARVTVMYAHAGQVHLDAFLSLLALAQTSPISYPAFTWKGPLCAVLV